MVSIILKSCHTVSSEIELFSAAQQRSTNHLSKGWIITHSHKTNNLLLLADIIKITFQPHWAESKGLRPQGIVTVFSASGHFDSLRLLIFCLRACFVASTGAQCALCTYYMCVCGVHIYMIPTREAGWCQNIESGTLLLRAFKGVKTARLELILCGQFVFIIETSSWFQFSSGGLVLPTYSLRRVNWNVNVLCRLAKDSLR